MEGRKQLSNLLFQCFDGLKVYGKDPEQLENINSLFQLVLSDYSGEEVQKAFAFYLRTNSDMPAPADIAVIIDRGNKPPFSESVYVSISKKHPEDRDHDDWEYMKEYEDYIKSGKY